MDLAALLDDLDRESASLDELVASRLDDWARPTPAEGWTVAHQIAHLAWTDDAAALAATDQAGFAALVDRALVDPAPRSTARRGRPPCSPPGARVGPACWRPCGRCRRAPGCPGSAPR